MARRLTHSHLRVMTAAVKPDWSRRFSRDKEAVSAAASPSLPLVLCCPLAACSISLSLSLSLPPTLSLSPPASCVSTRAKRAESEGAEHSARHCDPSEKLCKTGTVHTHITPSSGVPVLSLHYGSRLPESEKTQWIIQIRPICVSHVCVVSWVLV